MPGRSFTSPNGYRYGFGGKESDDEIKGNDNSLDFGARIYDSRLGRWLACDPLAMKYSALSPFQYSANSPVALTDPDGRWIPEYDTKTNTVIFKAEKGDNYYTFTMFLGISDQNKNRTSNFTQINLIRSYRIYKKMQNNTISLEPGMLKYITASLVDSEDHPEHYRSDKDQTKPDWNKANYNCWNSAIGGSLEKEFSADVYKEKYATQDPYLTSDYSTPLQFNQALGSLTAITKEEAFVGKTILRFGQDMEIKGKLETNVTTHGAIFMGTDSNGNLYAYTKNGWFVKAQIVKLAFREGKGYYIPGLEKDYGYVKGVKAGETGFYNSSGTKDALEIK